MVSDNFDFFVNDILLLIKNKLKKNYIYLEEEREKIIDNKFLEIIEKNKDDLMEFELNEGENNSASKREFINYLCKYYFALYNDNVELLHKLIQYDFRWNTKFSIINLFALDRRISSNFKDDKYIYILRKNENLFLNFYMEMYNENNINQTELEILIEKFSNILKRNKNISKTKNPLFKNVDSLLNLEVLMNFNEDEILKFNDTQKYVLGCLTRDKRNINDYIINLIKKYNYSKNLVYWQYYQKFFTDDEVLNLTDDDIRLYNKIFSFFEIDDLSLIQIILKIRKIREINPCFNRILSPYIYRVLSPEQILSLSDEAIYNIEKRITMFLISEGECFNYNNLAKIIINEQRNDNFKNSVKRLLKIRKKNI